MFGINIVEDVLFNEVLLSMPMLCFRSYNFNIDILNVGNDNFTNKNV